MSMTIYDFARARKAELVRRLEAILDEKAGVEREIASLDAIGPILLPPGEVADLPRPAMGDGDATAKIGPGEGETEPDSLRAMILAVLGDGAMRQFEIRRAIQARFDRDVSKNSISSMVGRMRRGGILSTDETEACRVIPGSGAEA
jgi:hypothetical protein